MCTGKLRPETRRDSSYNLTGGWSPSVLQQQRNWIGRSEGALVKFTVATNENFEKQTISTFTSRVDTLFGVTGVVVSPSHPILDWAVEQGCVEGKSDFAENLATFRAKVNENKVFATGQRIGEGQIEVL